MAIIGIAKLAEIVDLAKGVPQEYRLKCFELILTRTLEIQPAAPAKATSPRSSGKRRGKRA